MYLDPPYNSKTSEILYKNDYRHSSWLSLIDNRLAISDRFATPTGSHVIAIDENEQVFLGQLIMRRFPANNNICVSIVHNKKGIQGDHLSYNHDFAYFSIPRDLKSISGRPVEKGNWDYVQLRKWGRESERSAEGIRYVTHRDRAQLPTTRGIWSTALTTDQQGRRRHLGHRIDTWARQTKHADGITWFLSKLQTEARDDPGSELLWSVPTARADRAYNWGDSAIAPDAVGEMTAEGLRIPFYFEYELRARHPQGVIARLDPYESYYWSNEHKEDQPPYPVTLFVVDTEDAEATYVRTAARMSRMSLPILVSCIPVLSTAGILGRSWRPLWEPESPRLPLSGLRAYQWDSLYHRMRHRPVRRA